jgi:hypothetical protein
VALVNNFLVQKVVKAIGMSERAPSNLAFQVPWQVDVVVQIATLVEGVVYCNGPGAVVLVVR